MTVKLIRFKIRNNSTNTEALVKEMLGQLNVHIHECRFREFEQVVQAFNELTGNDHFELIIRDQDDVLIPIQDLRDRLNEPIQPIV